MKQYDFGSLVVQDNPSPTSSLTIDFRSEEVGWDINTFEARRLAKGQRWSAETGEDESGIVLLAGIVDIQSNQGIWQGIGEWKFVFSGLPHTLYLPKNCFFEITAQSDCEFAITRMCLGMKAGGMYR